ncbi:MAG: PIN domain-containing protein [Cyanobacteriota bacterium]|nr:PIN domain-containing protein [Cyanobacteriota bacterium]
MQVILYLETNFLLAMAKGRNGSMEEILQTSTENVTIAIPSICLMESLVAWEKEEKRSQSFSQKVKIEISEAKRNVRCEDARYVAESLEKSLISYNNLLLDLDKRFKNVFEILKNRAELIHPKIENLQSTLNEPRLTQKWERRDDFILQCILDHASSNQDKTKAFFSENSKQFRQSAVRDVLTEKGIRYFSNSSNLQSWLQSWEKK